jgi:methylated-DNA-[protein]-cysteine S-methyltransferase
MESQAWKFQTAIGTMGLTWRGARITAIQLPEANERELLARLRKKTGEAGLAWAGRAPAFVIRAARGIQAQLEGRGQRFTLEDFAFEELAPFFRKVYERAARIPPGEVRSYKELAAAAGNPKAFRAVGQANHHR